MHKWLKRKNVTLVGKRLTMSTLHTSGRRVKYVNIIHKWLKCKNYALLVKRLLMSILCTRG